MLTRHLLSLIFDEAVQNLNSACHQVNSQPANATLSGYVHLLDQGNAIFITDERKPYLITLEFTLFHKLKTGDRLQARVVNDSANNHNVVSEIVSVQHVTYDDAPVISAIQTLNLFDNTINLGTSILIPVGDNTDIVTKVAHIVDTLPDNITPILLSFDGRPTNFNVSTAYFTQPSYDNREK